MGLFCLSPFFSVTVDADENHPPEICRAWADPYLKEAGTEAAAATAAVVSLTSVPEAPVTIKIDRPFVFFIRDIPTGTILFIGRVMNPA